MRKIYICMNVPTVSMMDYNRKNPYLAQLYTHTYVRPQNQWRGPVMIIARRFIRQLMRIVKEFDVRYMYRMELLLFMTDRLMD